MGWLEVLALLKRLAPLLTKVAPMLETFVAARAGAGARDEAALQRMGAELQAGVRADLVSITAAHRTATDDALAQQAAELRELRAELKHLREENAVRSAEAEQKLSAAARTLQGFVAATMVLVAICLVLLILRK